jgi:ribonuclease HI
MDLQNWMLEWLASVKDNEMEIVLMTLYQSWLARNAARESQKIEDPVAIADRAIHLTEKWLSLQEPKPCKPVVPPERWLPPARDWVKVNSDGAKAKSSEKGGGGVVIRDHDGRFLAGSCRFFPFVVDPEEAELKACKQALELVKVLRLQKIVLEVDSINVVSKLSDSSLDRSAHALLVEEIKNHLRDLDEFVVKWARRSANGVAHKLAKEGCGLELSQSWFTMYPDCIVDVLAHDLSGFE